MYQKQLDTHTHTHTHTHIISRTSPNEWTTRRRSRYLHNKHKIWKTIISAGFEPAIPTFKRL